MRGSGDRVKCPGCCGMPSDRRHGLDGVDADPHVCGPYPFTSLEAIK